ncbi:hypothetical protein BBG19_1065 [Francisella sp. MA067296]|nr:hypothetical protein BBG19_1065 [Francisella sp. MA067296]
MERQSYKGILQINNKDNYFAKFSKISTKYYKVKNGKESLI